LRMIRVGFFSLILCFLIPSLAKAAEINDQKVYQARMNLYKNMEAVTQIPWYYLAAVDHYERSLRIVRTDLPKPKGVTGIYIPPEKWCGWLNPNHFDDQPLSILVFDGMGVDGNGDGKASLKEDEDILFAFAHYILNYGIDDDHFRMALWNYYKRDKSVGLILEKAKLYQHFGKLDLNQKAFPLPLRSNHSYRSTWGDSRGWGGRRIHEGTDIFADYGVPVKATTYGIIEMKGWNKYGGWRIGIRDINNTYHYFAHLSGFSKGLKVGQIVEPGMVIGSVGSTGYGPPGTSGKFPPHLHYGMYKDNGKREWSFDPYPHLRTWEILEKRKKK
jgi:peptidoglycan LD-endopeptidase LytH